MVPLPKIVESEVVTTNGYREVFVEGAPDEWYSLSATDTPEVLDAVYGRALRRAAAAAYFRDRMLAEREAEAVHGERLEDVAKALAESDGHVLNSQNGSWSTPQVVERYMKSARFLARKGLISGTGA